MNHTTRLQPTTSLFFITLTLICIALSPAPNAFGVVPPPDGGYTGFNTAEGQNSLFSLTTGVANTASGWHSLFGDASGSFNTATGAGTLLFNTGDANTAVGTAALLFNNIGSGSTAVGATALLNNTADGNTATGAFALHDNTIGGTLEISNQGFDLGPNTAVGSHALESNIDSSGNTAVGYQALRSMVTGFMGDPHQAINTAVGFQALANVNGPHNAANNAFGYQALVGLTDGGGNVAIGNQTLADLSDGTINVAVGHEAGRGLESGNGNIYIGGNLTAGASPENSHTYIGNINTTPVSGGGTDTVTINLTTGLLGHLSSSRRYKEDIKPMDTASELLYRLKPVTYHYKKEIDRSQAPDYGLVAEDVAEIDRNLTVCNKDGQIESVRYNAINAMLLNEFLKEHRKVEKLEATVAQQQKDIAAAVAELKGQLQKVSARAELKESTAQTTANSD